MQYLEGIILKSKYRVIVGLPAFNEAQVLPLLLDRIILLRQLFEELQVVVIDDGSTDDTPQVLFDYSSRHAFIRYITHPENRGLGAAVQSLFHYIIPRFADDDVLLTMDADNTHDPQIIPQLVAKLKDEKLDLVIASRFTAGGKEVGLALKRRLCSRGVTCLLRIFFPIPNVKDYSCGYRAYNLGYLKQAMALYHGELVTSRGFECMAEILARFSRIGVKAAEYPLVLRYDFKCGKSKMRIMRTIMGYFKLLGRVKKPLYFDR